MVREYRRATVAWRTEIGHILPQVSSRHFSREINFAGAPERRKKNKNQRAALKTKVESSLSKYIYRESENLFQNLKFTLSNMAQESVHMSLFTV